ncbi:MAG: DUF3179 domain-containing protein [Anaerolineaceae bacterium]|nr:DUF3179 domain-containing protein [Anaerolineaceae bacterium]
MLYRRILSGVLVLLLGGLALSALTAQAVHAQLSCDNPFGGLENQPRNLNFWDKTDFCQTSIDYSEVLSGGPPPNGIPPLGFPGLPDPTFESIVDAQSWLVDESPVIAVEINDEARAYPLAILIWHEIVNDTLGDVPVAVTFCPLCNSSLVFDRHVGDSVLAFGTTGNLRNSDLIMWDDQTQSWWQQFTGEGIVGAYTGTQLELIPSQVVGFSQFAAQYPDGQVLTRDTTFGRDYGINPYPDYDTRSRPYSFFTSEIDDRLPALERVLAGVIGGQPVAYPFSVLAQTFVIDDTVGEQDIVAFWQPGVKSALGDTVMDNAQDIGTAALFSRALDGQTLTFTADENGVIHDAETGSTWNAFGTAVAGELSGSQLRQLSAAPHFWFAWSAFHPDTSVYAE